MRDFQNAFDAALAGVDSTIVEVMGIRAQFTSGAQRGGEVQGVFDDPESLGFAGGGVRIEGSSPSLFVRTDTVRAVRRGDTLTINGEMFWVDRVSPDDGGSCYLWLNRGQPTGFYRVPLSSAQAGDILLCCFGASVPNHAAIYCGNGELLHHLPEQLSKRERYSEKWQRRTHSVWRHRHWHASAFTGIYNDLAAASACM